MSPPKKKEPRWIINLENTYAIHNVISWHPELTFFLVRWDGKENLEWMDISDPRTRIKPFHFEIFYGKESLRDEYYLEGLKEASETDEVVSKELFGFGDLFYKLPTDYMPNAFILAGQFLRKQPNWEGISESWRVMTGQEPASANPDFVHFVKMALSLPVFEEELRGAVKEFIKLYASYICCSDKTSSIRDRVNNLNRDYFVRLWPVNDEVDSVISSDKFLLPPWYYDGDLTDWMKEGMGITQLPNTAMAMMPLDSRSDVLDPVQTRLRNAQIQRECIAFARDVPETAATKLQDYGVSIITLCKSGKSVARARIELREIAQKFRHFVSDRFDVRLVVGIGQMLSKGAPLHESHRDAVLALHMCVQLEKDVLFYDEHGSEGKFKYSRLQKFADDLGEALDRESSTELKLASDQYVQLVLRYANERIEVVRSQFLTTLFQLLKTVQRRNPMRSEARDSFADDLTKRIEEARSLNHVIEAFNAALQRLNFVSSKAWHGPSVMLLEATLQYLRENFFESLPLPEVARKAGFSVPAFTRIFKQTTGTSFLSYLRSIRIEHAKKLLTTTGMTTEQIAQACGFNSQHHLIRSFKKVTSQTPGAYRKKNQNRRADV